MGSLLRPTTEVFSRVAGAWVLTDAMAGYSGGVRGALDVSARVLGGWLMRYSTPDVTASGGGAAGAHGASASGTPSVQVFATPGGVDSGSRAFSWAYLSGDVGIAFAAGSLPTDKNPTIKRDITGVANGTTSGGVSAVIRCTMTDTITGAQVYSDVTVGPFTWTNDIPAFTPHTNAHRIGGTSGTENVPAGATSLTIKVIGAGGGGGGSSYDVSSGEFSDGETGGDGGVTSITRAIAPGDVGAPIFWSVGAGSALWPSVGDTSSTSGSVAAGSCALAATGGSGGVNGFTGHTSGSGTKGSPNNALLGDGYGVGGPGGTGGDPSSVGADGEVLFIWT